MLKLLCILTFTGLWAGILKANSLICSFCYFVEKEGLDLDVSLTLVDHSCNTLTITVKCFSAPKTCRATQIRCLRLCSDPIKRELQSLALNFRVTAFLWPGSGHWRSGMRADLTASVSVMWWLQLCLQSHKEQDQSVTAYGVQGSLACPLLIFVETLDFPGFHILIIKTT